MRVVFDTNVIISALLMHNSTPRRAFYKALEQDEILISIPVISELSEVLSRKKFDPYLLAEEKERFLIEFVQETQLVEIIESFAV